jgi:P27 family predicted phage terminase small subunit
MVCGSFREKGKKMKHRGRKSAAELSVIPVHHPPPKRDAPSTPPDHLQPATKIWWQSITAEFQLEKYQFAVLQSAAEAWDLYRHALTELNKHGLTFTDAKGMVRARPEAAIARDARTSFLRALRELRLNVDPPLSEEERTARNNLRGNSWATNRSYYDRMADDDAS